MSINKAIIVGRLGSEPEMREVSGGKSFCRFSVATSKKYRKQDGTDKEDTQWHKVVVWGVQAQSCKQYLSKGRQVYVEGEIRHRKWKDKEGADHFSSEIIAWQVQFLGSPSSRVSSSIEEGGSESGAEPEA